MEQIICQSCSMEMPTKDLRGSNKDGSKNEEYCVYCFENGVFTHNMTLEEVIADSVNYAEEAGMTKEEMLAGAKEILPTLKRWKTQ